MGRNIFKSRFSALTPHQTVRKVRDDRLRNDWDTFSTSLGPKAIKKLLGKNILAVSPATARQAAKQVECKLPRTVSELNS